MKKLFTAFFAIAFAGSAFSQQLPPRPPHPPHPAGLRTPPEPPRPKTPGEVASDVKHFFRGDRKNANHPAAVRHDNGKHKGWHKTKKRKHK